MNYSRQDYLNGNCTHAEYYAQFVTSEVMNRVRSSIGEARIKASTDTAFNDIPLAKWDNMRGAVSGSFSLGEAVCILKEAARQIREE